MGRGYDCLIIMIVEFFLLMALMTRNINSYPHGNDAIQFINNESDVEGRSTKIRTRSERDEDRMYSDSKIVFPGDVRRVPVCKGLTYCETVDSYPADLVTKAIQRNDSLKYLATVDMIPVVAQRFDENDVPLCASSENVVYPQSAETKDNEWKYVANQEGFKQGVRIETCIKENNSCSVLGGLPEGYKTTCKQKYVNRQLAAILTDGSVVPEIFRFPSSCCCHVKFVGDAMTRIGLSFGAQKSQVTPVKTRKRK